MAARTGAVQGAPFKLWRDTLLLDDMNRRPSGIAAVSLAVLNVVRHVSDRIGVMYLGRLVEVAPADELFARPAHPYTAALIAAIPSTQPGGKPRAVVAPGELPSPSAPPSGCHFHPRCPAATERCRNVAPALTPLACGRAVACHFPL